MLTLEVCRWWTRISLDGDLCADSPAHWGRSCCCLSCALLGCFPLIDPHTCTWSASPSAWAAQRSGCEARPLQGREVVATVWEDSTYSEVRWTSCSRYLEDTAIFIINNINSSSSSSFSFSVYYKGSSSLSSHKSTKNKISIWGKKI